MGIYRGSVPGAMLEIKNVAVNNTATVFPSLVGLTVYTFLEEMWPLKKYLLMMMSDQKLLPTGEMKKFGAHRNPDLMRRNQPCDYLGKSISGRGVSKYRSLEMWSRNNKEISVAGA